MSPVYNLKSDLEKWPAFLRLSLFAIVSALLSSLVQTIIYGLLDQMAGNRLSSFVTTSLAVALALLMTRLVARRYFLLVSGVIGLLFGVAWWWIRLGSRPDLANVVPTSSQILFASHYPLAFFMAVACFTILERIIVNEPLSSETRR